LSKQSRPPRDPQGRFRKRRARDQGRVRKPARGSAKKPTAKKPVVQKQQQAKVKFPKRDEQGRFRKRAPAKKPAGKKQVVQKRSPAQGKFPQRDEQGRFRKRAPAKKPAGKKPVVQKRPPARGKLPQRDEQVRFRKRGPAKKPVAKKPVVQKRPPARGKLPQRDEQGRFRKRGPAKKPVAKKPVVQKRPPARGKLPLRDEEGRFRKRPARGRPAQKPEAKKPPVKPVLPPISERSLRAESEMQEKLLSLLDGIALLQSDLDMAVQTFINRDGSVDGELTIRNLPDEWRDEDGIRLLIATLSSALRTFRAFDPKPAMGGAFWATYGIRFGPQNESELGELAELYKRHKGMFQIGTYPMHASGTGSLQIGLAGENVGLRAMLESLLRKRGLPPTVILIRFIWTPDGQRPGHYKGEKG
jgi:hypothetical protein